MAYQAKRSKKVIEDFELVNENDQVEHVLHVELDAGSMVEKIRKKYVDLVRVQEEVSNINPKESSVEEVQNAYTKLGMSVVAIIEAVFGVEDGGKILEFYENNYVDMVRQVIPFITTVVLPKMNEVAQQNKKEILSSYNRKARRKMMKGWK